jgi:hypothetical protein
MSEPQHEPYTGYSDPDTGKPELGRLVEAVAADAKAYFEAQKALTTLEVSEKVGRGAAVSLLAVVLILIVSAAFLMGSVALSLWLAHLLHSTMLGFLAVAGLYLLLGVVFYLLWRTVLRDKVILTVIRSMHEDH